MYAITVVAMIVLGLACSAGYVLSWTPAMVKAKRHGMTSLTGWEIVDFAALPASCFSLLMLSLVNVFLTGVPSAPSLGLAIQRIATLALIDIIVALRALRWFLVRREASEAERETGVALIRDPRKRTS